MSNILIVEPDKVLADTYADFLRHNGHDTRVAATAQEAIHAADDLRPDLVLLEVQLVAHSGIEFLYEFRSYEDWRSVPVIILSTVPPSEFRQMSDSLMEQLGVSSYRYKPRTNLKELLGVVNAVVRA